MASKFSLMVIAKHAFILGGGDVDGEWELAA